MRNTKRIRVRRAGRPALQKAGLRTTLGAKLERVLADIGWICGWREEGVAVAPVARRSSRRRVMLGRAVAAAEVQAEGDFGSVETKCVSTGRPAQSQSGWPDPAVDLPDLVLDVQDEIAYQLSNATDAAQLLSDPRVRSFGQQLAEKKVTRWLQ